VVTPCQVLFNYHVKFYLTDTIDTRDMLLLLLLLLLSCMSCRTKLRHWVSLGWPLGDHVYPMYTPLILRVYLFFLPVIIKHRLGIVINNYAHVSPSNVLFLPLKLLASLIALTSFSPTLSTLFRAS